jgi:uncharacterized protein YcbK (DUF882 family)
MATPTRSLDYSLKYPMLNTPMSSRIGRLKLKASVALMLVFSVLTFITALYYVRQQVRLRTLNYEIIELKKHKKELIEQQKTYQLQLDQLKRLDQIERDVRKKGFVPVDKDQIHVVQ